MNGNKDVWDWKWVGIKMGGIGKGYRNYNVVEWKLQENNCKENAWK